MFFSSFGQSFLLSILRWGKLATRVCMSDLREGVGPSKWGIYLCEWWRWGGVYRASIKQSEEISVLQLLQLSCVAPTEAINISNINIIFGYRLVVTTVHMLILIVNFSFICNKVLSTFYWTHDVLLLLNILVVFSKNTTERRHTKSNFKYSTNLFTFTLDISGSSFYIT